MKKKKKRCGQLATTYIHQFLLGVLLFKPRHISKKPEVRSRIHFSQVKTEDRTSHKQTATESGCRKDLAKLLREGNPAYSVVLEFQEVIDC